MSHARRPPADVVASIRRSIVGVRARSARGTGWVALGNDLVVTSQRAVGYEVDVQIEVEGGSRHAARVIWVDVPRDLAALLPVQRLSLPPLAMRPDLPRLGETAFLVSAVPSQPLRMAQSIVSAVDSRAGTSRCFEIDAAPGSPGSPVVDADGQIIGVGGLDLPRGAHRSETTAGSPRARTSIALPVAALQRALSVFDVPIAQLAARTPTYRCPSCTEPFGVEEERCLACGRLLPHAFDGSPSLLPAENLLRRVLAHRGALSTSVRVGPHTFRAFVPPATGDEEMSEVLLEVDAQGETLRASLPIALVPSSSQEPLFRFLLTLNDQLPSGFRVALDGDAIAVGFVEPCVRMTETEGGAMLAELMRLGARYRKMALEAFEASPIWVDE